LAHRGIPVPLTGHALLSKPLDVRQLAVARRAAGMTQAAVAEALGIHRQSVSAIERGVDQPSAFLRSRMLDLYGVSE
jgi:DNA-binding XRE family transcriptional regulator